MFFEAIRSERLLMRHAADRLSVRWYIGYYYDLNEPLPDHSSLTHIREGYGVEVFRRFFAQNYTPVLFDFKVPPNRDVTEMVSTLAHMARFVIADITDAKSIHQELMSIVPNLPSVPVQPLILNSQQEYGMFEHFTRFPWILPVYRYMDVESLLHSLNEKVIAPAEQKAKELEKR